MLDLVVSLLQYVSCDSLEATAGGREVSVVQVLGINAIVIFVYMTGLWITSLARRDVSIVDSFWGLGFVVSAVVYFVFTDGLLARKILLLTIVGIWGLRLSFYIFRRNYGKPEDPRYAAMRAKRGPAFWWVSYFQIFLLQGALMFSI